MLEANQRMPSPLLARGAPDERVPGRWAEAVARFDRAAESSDEEVVAVVQADGTLVWLDNVGPDRRGRFRVPVPQWISVIGTAELILHSHPGGEQTPSFADQRQQIASGKPWYVKPRGAPGFFFGDGSPVRPLLGRPYRFGVTDCFATARDALRELFGISIRNHPREWGYSKRGDPIFEQSLADEGFEEVSHDLSDAQPGDGLLFRIRSKHANHCGVVLEGGRMIHHPTPGKMYDPTTVSTEVSVGRWRRIPVTVVRHA